MRLGPGRIAPLAVPALGGMASGPVYAVPGFGERAGSTWHGGHVAGEEPDGAD
jgi:hypothetical protein